MRSSPEVGRETSASRPRALEDDGRRSGVNRRIQEGKSRREQPAASSATSPATLPTPREQTAATDLASMEASLAQPTGT